MSRRILLRAFMVSLAIGFGSLNTSCQSAKGMAMGEQYGAPISAEKGTASFYSVRTNRGSRTASGKPLCDHTLTAAHRRLPFGTPVRVTNVKNGKSVVVTITDRGPFIRGRIIDVSVAAARELDFVSRGLVPVKVEVLAKRKGA